MKDKRRWKERGKSVLILLLSASAIYLLTLTPLVQDSGVLDLFSPRQENGSDSAAVTLTAAARPSRMAVNAGNVRYGVQYDQSAVDELFAYLSPLLGEALVSSAQPQRVTEGRWQNYLQGICIYFDFSGEVPLSALGGWLSQRGTCDLEDSARRIMLAKGLEDMVLLCYQSAESGLLFACETGLTGSLHLLPAVSGVTENGVRFAFEGEDWAKSLHPYTLLTDVEERRSYTVTTPLSADKERTWLLEALDYTGRNHASVSSGELYLDGNDRLHVLNGGCVTFDAAQGGKYPVATTEGSATVAEAIECARELAESTIGTMCGEAELYLVSAETLEEGYRIRFGYRLDGSTVWLYDEGWAAEFIVSDQYVTQFTLYFRCYTANEGTSLMLPMEKAAVILPGLTEEPMELVIQYRDRGESVIVPGWIAQS